VLTAVDDRIAAAVPVAARRAFRTCLATASSLSWRHFYGIGMLTIDTEACPLARTALLALRRWTARPPTRRQIIERRPARVRGLGRPTFQSIIFPPPATFRRRCAPQRWPGRSRLKPQPPRRRRE